VTENERIVLRYIERHQQRHGVQPSHAAVARAMGWRSAAYAGKTVRRLIARGALTKSDVLRVAGGEEDRALAAELRALAGMLNAPAAVSRALTRAADRIEALASAVLSDTPHE